jgi:hydrogenase expression/formation protein HypE
MTIISQREDIKFQSELRSDCAGLGGQICGMLEETKGVKFMRDPTRGGLAATLNEVARGSGLSVLIRERDIPINRTVQAAADMLGFDVLNIANEGKFVAVVSAEEAQKCVGICRKHKLGNQASVIGEITATKDVPVVEIETRIGGRRIVQMPYGRELPRIC